MKTKGFLKGLFGLFLGLGLTSTAQAVTLVRGESYSLSRPGGVVQINSAASAFTGPYSVLNTSFFTYNFDNTISIVLNLAQNIANGGETGTLRIDRLDLNANQTLLTPPADANIAIFSGGYQDVGDFVPTFAVTPTTNLLPSTNFAILASMPGRLNASANTLQFWGKFFGPTGGLIGNQVDFHLRIGPRVSIPGTIEPEPMSMSLLGMGLIGGVINRRRRAKA